jgi:hypothetical protein
MTFVPSLAEDLVTRGYPYRSIPVRWTGPRFVLVSSLFYVANHVYRLGLGPVEWGMLFCFGLPYAAALWRSGTLFAALGLHWGWNLGNALADGVHPYDVLRPGAGRLLSAAARLVLLTLVLVIPVRKLREG